ncbi:MAG: SGNH/GDSL hydrolase family protein [Steroidobacteraceae bacterium]
MLNRTMLSRGLKWLGLLFIAAIVTGELFARLYLGLGDPPLSQTHPTIEYLFMPNQKVHRFGNLFQTNRYGMRSDDFQPQKLDPKELRVMVYGDSVVNGGNLTDQPNLATSIMQRTLAKELGRPVIVGNISAGSWGPLNEYAYLRQYGFLDADILVIVLSSSDYDDAPTFEPLDPMTHPTEKPFSALWEGLTRYLPRYLHGTMVNEAGVVPDAEEVPNKRDIEVSLEAERDFLEMAKAYSVKVLVVQHWTRSELRGRKPLQGHTDIRRVADASAVPVYDDADKLQLFLDAGTNPFRDDIHLNDNGQQALAELLLAAFKKDFPDVVAPQNMPGGR